MHERGNGDNSQVVEFAGSSQINSPQNMQFLVENAHKIPEKLLSRISKSSKQSKRIPSNDEKPSISMYCNALIVGKHLVKWSATFPVPRTCPICKISFPKSSLNQFTLMSICLDLRWRSEPSKSIFPLRESVHKRIGQTTSKLSSSDEDGGYT